MFAPFGSDGDIYEPDDSVSASVEYALSNGAGGGVPVAFDSLYFRPGDRIFADRMELE